MIKQNLKYLLRIGYIYKSGIETFPRDTINSWLSKICQIFGTKINSSIYYLLMSLKQ